MTLARTFGRRAVLAGAACASLAACKTTGLQGRTFSVATLNIWHDAGDWPARLPLVVDTLRMIDADAIALQEVLQDSSKRLPNQATTIAEALGGYSVHFSSTSPLDAPSRYGNAILSRVPVVAEEWRLLEPRNDYRTALRVRLAFSGGPVDVVSTHLAWQADAAQVRLRQVSDLLDWLPEDGVPQLLLGDFNAELGTPELAPLLARFASALPMGATPTTLNPASGHADRVIDHILAETRAFRTVSAHRIGDRSRRGLFPSDHFGVAAALRLL